MFLDAPVIEQIIATCTKKRKTYTTINYSLKKQILVTEQKIITYTKPNNYYYFFIILWIPTVALLHFLFC